MLVALLMVATQARIDTLDLKAVMQVSIEHAVDDLSQRGDPLRSARLVHIDVASFRKAAGLDDDVPEDWRSIASVVGAKGDIRRARDIWQCDPAGDKHGCKSLATGEVLIHASKITRDASHLTVQVSIEWALPGGGSQGKVYDVFFNVAGNGYTFDSIQLFLLTNGR